MKDSHNTGSARGPVLVDVKTVAAAAISIGKVAYLSNKTSGHGSAGY